ncbi:lipopolysaccharide assembly protein LapA domain-containing protein [Thalassovita aquimarina]|uniref:LapA family protein n=1 Tax=Thalassovita aquimarina TaxID=2785917 RepID=A0ABS5HUP6_9RHOB|nr:LapA family protein [Thalassovita aquimarina]MBR9652619.1 LapA family protein [Thalassovita aquimarina]
MRYIRYAFLASLGAVLVSVALANRGMVSLSLLPEALAELTGLSYTVELPLFVVIFGGIVAGLLIGFFWEWMREYKHRAEASRKAREVHDLERQLKREKRRADTAEQKDEVLALLDEAS